LGGRGTGKKVESPKVRKTDQTKEEKNRGKKKVNTPNEEVNAQRNEKRVENMYRNEAIKGEQKKGAVCRGGTGTQGCPG